MLGRRDFTGRSARSRLISRTSSKSLFCGYYRAKLADAVCRAKNAEDRPKTEEAKRVNENLRKELGELKNEQSRLILEFDESKRERAALVEKAVSRALYPDSRSVVIDMLTDESEQHKSRDQPITNQTYRGAIPSGSISRTYQAIHL